MADSLFQTLLAKATTPLVPASVTQPLTNSLTEPSLTQSPAMASLKGFGAGALEGARGLTSPANIAGTLGDDLPIAMGAGLAAKYFPKVAQALPEVAAAAPKLGEMAAEFAPVGGEAIYNAGKAAYHAAADPAMSAYFRLLASRGR